MNHTRIAVLALLLAACTKAQQVTGIQVAGAICAGIAIASSHVEDAPICATAEEWLLAQQALYGAKSFTLNGMPAVPQAELDKLYAQIVKQRVAGAK